MNRLKIIQILVVLGITVNSISSLEQKFPSFPPVFPFFPHFWENSLTLSKQSKIDHFVFALSWPVTPIWAFNDGAPAAQNSSWVIKGLWPEVRGKERPSPMYCSENHPFNKTAISSIEEDLKSLWPGSDGRTAEEVWRLVWRQFGTCAIETPNINSEFDYFNTSLHLHEKFPIHDWFAEKRIYPHPSRSLKKSQISSAIFCKTGKRPYLRCSTEHHQQYLQSVMICVDLDLNPVDCSHWNAESHEFLCTGGGIIFPDTKPDHDYHN